MNGLILMACTIVALFVGYRFYARWLENTWGVDPNEDHPKGGGEPAEHGRDNRLHLLRRCSRLHRPLRLR